MSRLSEESNLISCLNHNCVACYCCSISILVSWSLPTNCNIVCVHCCCWCSWWTRYNTSQDLDWTWWLTIANWVASIYSEAISKTRSQSSCCVRFVRYISCNGYPNADCLVCLNFIVNNWLAAWKAIRPTEACWSLRSAVWIQNKLHWCFRYIWNKDCWSSCCIWRLWLTNRIDSNNLGINLLAIL